MNSVFIVQIGLQYVHMMSPELLYVDLFNMDGVVMEVNVRMRMLGKGLSVVNVAEIEWNLNSLLFADDTPLLVDSEK